MRWDRAAVGVTFIAAMVALLSPRDEWGGGGYYGYQDITESQYELDPLPTTTVIKPRPGWPSVALVVPIAWAIVLLIIALVLL